MPMAAPSSPISRELFGVRLSMDVGEEVGQDNCPNVRNAAEVAMVFGALAELPREVLIVGAVDCKLRLLHWTLGAVGSSAFCAVMPCDVFRGAVLTGAVGVFLVHNHPSGSLEPSTADYALTRAMQKAARTMRLPVL